MSRRRIFHCQDCWDLEDAYNRRYGMDCYGYDFREELSGPDGMHYHVWIKRRTREEESAELHALYSRIARDRDITGLSYAYLPEET